MTKGPLETTTKIVPGAVTFQNTEAMTKVRNPFENEKAKAISPEIHYFYYSSF